MNNFILFILFSVHVCLEGGKAFVIQPKKWDYKGHDIGYEVSRQDRSAEERGNKEPILVLNGFGVGSFHQHRLIPELLEGERDSQVIYCIDYLGQGRSWPKDCQDGSSNSEKDLIYSAQTWIDQLTTFIEEVILPEHPDQKVHVVGNSVGGHLAAHLAYRRPDLIRSICLLNPTPVWGLNLPGWSGHLPAPSLPKAIGRYLFDRIRDLNTIEKYLDTAYARKEAFDNDLMQQIRGCTLGDGGHAAFASILWSPPLKVQETKNFQRCLSGLDCDVLLVFGRDDPWCKPAFAKKMLQALKQRGTQKIQRYVEVENCGHCPNHEAPQAVGDLVRSWVNAKTRDEGSLSLVKSEEQKFEEPWGDIIIQERQEEDIELGIVDFLAVTFV